MVVLGGIFAYGGHLANKEREGSGSTMRAVAGVLFMIALILIIGIVVYLP